MMAKNKNNPFQNFSGQPAVPTPPPAPGVGKPSVPTPPPATAAPAPKEAPAPAQPSPDPIDNIGANTDAVPQTPPTTEPKVDKTKVIPQQAPVASQQYQQNNQQYVTPPAPAQQNYPPQNTFNPADRRTGRGLAVGIVLGCIAAIAAAICVWVFVIFPAINPSAGSSPSITTTAPKSSNKSSSNSKPKDTTSDSSSSSSSSDSSSKSTSPDTNEVFLSTYTATGEPISGIVRRDSNDYVLADSDNHLYTLSELKAKGLTGAELCIAWNEPFARQGYHFDNSALNDYFTSTKWYHDSGKTFHLTGTPAKNVDLLHELADQSSENTKWARLTQD